MEMYLNHKEIALGAFLDIEEASTIPIFMLFSRLQVSVGLRRPVAGG
jgi:hypothetical protein